jgi:hypothetical protein
MKAGDLIKFIGSWQAPDGPSTGIVLQVWSSGRTRKISSVDILWDSGKLGNVLASSVKVINESR